MYNELTTKHYKEKGDYPLRQLVWKERPGFHCGWICYSGCHLQCKVWLCHLWPRTSANREKGKTCKAWKTSFSRKGFFSFRWENQARDLFFQFHAKYRNQYKINCCFKCFETAYSATTRLFLKAVKWCYLRQTWICICYNDFFLVRIIPTINAIKAKGEILIKIHSNPWISTPAIANSGSL